MAKKKKSAIPGILEGLFVILVLVAILTFGYRYVSRKAAEKHPRVQQLEEKYRDLLAGMNVDSIRLTQIKKIITIIDRYNPDLPSGTKFEIAEEIYNMSIKYTNLDVDLICATITHDSGDTWEPEIVSAAGAMGLMQNMPASSVWVAHYEGITWTSPEEVLFNPIYNIRLGCRRLSTYIQLYGLEGGLAAYNGGEMRAAVWLANDKASGILWAETSNYIPHILRLYHEFKEMDTQVTEASM